MNDEKKAHIFSHLGQAPYRFLGFEQKTYQACPGAPIQVGGSCDHCGTGIIDTFYFMSADGVKFHVGSSCVNKAGDKGLKAQIAPAKRKIKAAKDAARIKAAVELIETLKGELEAEPHPMGFDDRETGEPLTRLDWVEWMLANSGTSGKLRVARFLEKKAKAAAYSAEPH